MMISRNHRLIDLYEIFLDDTQSRSFLQYPLGYTFMSKYESMHTQIDDLIINKYGSRVFSHYVKKEDDIEKEANTDDYQAFRIAINSAFYMNAENYQRAYDVLLEEYAPLNNYDKTSEVTEVHKGDILKKSGTETDTLTKSGTESNTTTMLGTETDTLTKSGTESNITTMTGTETDTLTKSGTESNVLTKNGVEKLSKVNDAKKDTTIKQVSPENSETFYNTEKTTENADKHTDVDSQTFENRTDANVTTYSGRADTNEKTFDNRSDTNTLSFDGRKDTNEKSFLNRENREILSFSDRDDTTVKSFTDRNDSVDFSITTTEKTSGNIGVTTSTEMVVSEYCERMKLNFLNDVIKQVIFEVTF